MDEDKIVDLIYDESPMEAYSGHLSVNPLTEESVVVGESADGKRKVIARNASTILPEATHSLPSKLDRQRLKELWGMDLRDPETYKRFNRYYRNEDGSINWHRFNFNPYIADRFVSMRNPEGMAKIRNAVKGGGDIAGAFGAAVLASPLVLEAAPLPALNRLGQSAVGQTAKVVFDPYTIPGAITNSALTAPFAVDMMNNGVNTENAVGVGLGALPYAGPALVRGYNIISNTAKQKYVAPYIASRILNRSINANPKGQILVSDSYFYSPYNWYRITESPEVYGIKEMGKNITTRDAVDIYIPSNQFRLGVIDNNLISRDGYWYKSLKPRFNISKRGSAHGNTSQAAKGHLWQGTTATSNRFQTAILEGDMPIQTYRGFDPATGLDSRTSFHLVDSETIPMGARIGFHTGEMPLDNLGYFLRLGNGKYSYQGIIIPDKRINVENY